LSARGGVRRYLFRQARTNVIVALVVAILRIFITTEEEVQRRALDLSDRMKAPQCDDGDRLRIIPGRLSMAVA